MSAYGPVTNLATAQFLKCLSRHWFRRALDHIHTVNGDVQALVCAGDWATARRLARLSDYLSELYWAHRKRGAT